MSKGNPSGVPFDLNLCHSLTISLIPIPRAAQFKSHDTPPCPQRRSSRTEGETLGQHLRRRSFHRSSSGPLKPSQDSGGSRAADLHFFYWIQRSLYFGKPQGQKQTASDLLPGFTALCQDSLSDHGMKYGILFAFSSCCCVGKLF